MNCTLQFRRECLETAKWLIDLVFGHLFLYIAQIQFRRMSFKFVPQTSGRAFGQSISFFAIRCLNMCSQIRLSIMIDFQIVVIMKFNIYPLGHRHISILNKYFFFIWKQSDDHMIYFMFFFVFYALPYTFFLFLRTMWELSFDVFMFHTDCKHGDLRFLFIFAEYI